MKKFFRIIKDAVRMVEKNIKSYAFLSVTIILSLSVLGIYMIYADSTTFNDNKETLKASPYIITLSFEKNDLKKIDLFSKKLDKFKDTHYYTYGSYQAIPLSDVNGIDNYHVIIGLYVIPDNVWGFYYNEEKRVVLSDGSYDFSLKKNEVIIPEVLYNAMYENEADTLEKKITLRLGDGENDTDAEFTVVNTFDGNYLEYDTESGKKLLYIDMYVGMSSLNDIDMGDFDEMYMTIYTHNVDELIAYMDELNLSNYSTAKYDKEKVQEEFIVEANIKMIIVVALIFLLGVNLFSSFSNAMKERRYEISVRRAMGASKTDIVIQFFLEGIIVMFIDVMISVAIILLALSCVKLYFYYVVSKSWIIFLSKYTIGMYAVSCIFLSVFFSIIFSVMATQVEIIRYLKGE